MLLDYYTKPDTVTCILCRATVSIRKGDKARFFNHISLDHEVHYDMDLFFVVSFLNMEQKKTVVDIINEKLLISNEGIDEDKMTKNDELEEETPIMNEELTSETVCEPLQNESESSSLEGSKSNTSSYLQIIQKFYENSKMTKEQNQRKIILNMQIQLMK